MAEKETETKQKLRAEFVDIKKSAYIETVTINIEPFTKEQVNAIKAKEKHKFYINVKFIIDWFLALIGIFLLVAPFILIGIISFVSDPGPIFFCQTRCGRNGKPFKIIKFRTMKCGVINKYMSAQELTSEDYQKVCNSWQRILRKTSIDELPQVFNIITGRMSIIGPRPLVYNEKSVIDGRIENGSIHCRPGLSGLAQISGRREVDHKSKATLDGEYYKKMNFCLDIKLFFLTIGKVFKREGAE